MIDHHLLGVHHVIERPGHLPDDLAFLASGVLLILGGGFAIARNPAGTAPSA